MSDKREEILSRIYTLLKTIQNVTVARDLDEMPEESRPCIVLLSGNETRSDSSEGRGLQVLMMAMAPMIAIGVSSTPDGVGPAANAIRAKILPAILGDAQLVTLMGKEAKGRIFYNGCGDKLSHGNLMASDLQLNFEIYYTLNPADLA